MVSHDKGDDLTDTERNTFVSRLKELKQNGSSLLIVGNIPDTTAAQACHWMLGNANSTDRRRLFISTDSNLPSITDRLSTSSEQLHADTTTLITWSANARSTTATPPQPMATEVTPVHVESNQLSELGITISQEIKTFEAIAGELAPSELRVCFDSLTALYTDYTADAIFRFLHILIGRIRTVQAMAHFHLPLDYDSNQVQQLAPLFDAIIELRVVDDQCQQQWHLQAEEIRSQWLTPTSSW